jgi:uncharacterized protein YggE
MCRLITRFCILVVFHYLLQSVTWSQAAGSRTGVDSNNDADMLQSKVDREVIEAFITIEGTSEIRVKPTEIRVVLAVTSEGNTANECHDLIEDSISKLRKSWSEMGVPTENLVEDFISVLPTYAWEIEKKGNNEVGVEKKVGYRMQTNLHVAVADDAQAEKTLAAAFQQGVSDIIAFDYWSKDLDDFKIKARDQALKAARSKSDFLLAQFDSRPPLINIQEQTTVHYPESLYHSFSNVVDSEVNLAWRRETTFFRAHRPRNTYYRGMQQYRDIQSPELPMKPEISVISSVRFFFESPAVKRAKKENKEDKN